MILYRVSLADEPKNNYVEADIKIVFEMLKEMGVWDGYTIHKIEMSKEEYINLPEFNGF